MEELRMIVEMVSKLPQLALWVLIGLFAYKIAVVGSIYGVIRFAIDKTHSWLTKPKHELKHVELRATIDGMCIRTEPDRLIAQLRRIAGKGVGIPTEYIHAQSVDWLRDAIDEKIEREAKRP